MISDLGRVGREPKLNKTAAGLSVMTIPVAYEYGIKKDGKRPTQWLELTVWGKQAEGLLPYMTVGKQIYFTAADVHVEPYERKDGVMAYNLVARCIDVKFAGGGKDNEEATGDKAEAGSPEPTPAPQNQQGVDGPGDDDIPFAPRHYLS
jgi:single-strand DNA-binding protein